MEFLILKGEEKTNEGQKDEENWSEIMVFVGENFKFKTTKNLKDRLLNHNALFTVAAISFIPYCIT